MKSMSTPSVILSHRELLVAATLGLQRQLECQKNSRSGTNSNLSYENKYNAVGPGGLWNNLLLLNFWDYIHLELSTGMQLMLASIMRSGLDQKNSKNFSWKKMIKKINIMFCFRVHLVSTISGVGFLLLKHLSIESGSTTITAKLHLIIGYPIPICIQCQHFRKSHHHE